MAGLVRQAWWTRLAAWGGGYVRAALSRVTSLRKSPPPTGGISSRTITSGSGALAALQTFATSPTVFAAINRTAFAIPSYPIKVYSGFSAGGGTMSPLDPEKVPWVASLLRLLEKPNPADHDSDVIFPSNPGEGMIAQVIADLKLSGYAAIIPTIDARGGIIGLTRAHPAQMMLIRYQGQEYWRLSVRGSQQIYPRGAVCVLRLLSWSNTGESEVGVGAATPLEPLLSAEAASLEATSRLAGQGGADIIVSGATPQTKAWLSNKENRQQLLDEITGQFSGQSEGRRIMVLGADIDVEAASWKPSDLAAEKTLAASEKAAMLTLGVVPVALGGDSGSYATAVQQYRTQAELDEALCGIIEVYFLRPLAQHFARRAGGRWSIRYDQVTARYDLASHPGNIMLRTEQISRLKMWREMGYTAAQAGKLEGIELPEPEGTPLPSSAAGKTAAQAEGTPAAPLSGRTLADWWPDTTTASSAATREAVRGDAAAEGAVSPWESGLEARRAASDEALSVAAQAVLDEERETYASRLEAQGRRETLLEAVLGDAGEAVRRWIDGLSESWRSAWSSSAEAALDAQAAPPASWSDIEDTWLSQSCTATATTSRERVTAIVERGLASGRTVADMAAEIRTSESWGPSRALLVARTETVRTETLGLQARLDAATRAGLVVEQEWSAAMDSATRSSHAALDAARAKTGEFFTFPSGVRTLGPGLSGDPSEDCNCRCHLRPVVKK